MNYLLSLHTSSGSAFLLETICGGPFANHRSLWGLVWCHAPSTSHNSPHMAWWRIQEGAGRLKVKCILLCIKDRDGIWGQRKDSCYVKGLQKLCLFSTKQVTVIIIFSQNVSPSSFSPFSCPFYLASNWDDYSNSFNALTVNHWPAFILHLYK